MVFLIAVKAQEVAQDLEPQFDGETEERRQRVWLNLSNDRVVRSIVTVPNEAECDDLLRL
jgi:hypothetical protein